MEEHAKIEIILEIISEEILGLKNVLSQQVAKINKMETVLISTVEKMAKPVVAVPPNIDLKPVIAAVQLGNQKIERLINTRPKTITRKIQLLHYPTEYAKDIYSRVLGWATLAVVAISIIVCTFQYYKFQTPLQLQIQKQELENDRIINAWKQLYKSGNYKEKKRMDSLCFGKMF